VFLFFELNTDSFIRFIIKYANLFRNLINWKQKGYFKDMDYLNDMSSQLTRKL